MTIEDEIHKIFFSPSNLGIKQSRTCLVAALLVMITGCTSPAGMQTTQQQINDALDRAPHGSVELSVDYCSPHKAGEQRTQVVEFGQGAVFSPTASAPYELVVTTFQAPSGDLLVSLRSKWIERYASTDGQSHVGVLFDKTSIIKAGGAIESLMFRVGDPETCLNLTAKPRLTMSTAASVNSIPPLLKAK